MKKIQCDKCKHKIREGAFGYDCKLRRQGKHTHNLIEVQKGNCSDFEEDK